MADGYVPYVNTDVSSQRDGIQVINEKYTQWKNEPNLRNLKLDFEGAKSAHDLAVGKINEWNDLLHVRGKHRPKKVKGRSAVQPKLVRRQTEWRYSALSEPFLGTDKLFSVKPATYEDTKAARQNQLVINHQFRNQFNRVKFVDDLVRATVDEGTCIIRAGWRRHVVPMIVEVPVYEHQILDDEEGLQIFQQALELRVSNPREYAETATPELKAAIDYFDETQQLNSQILLSILVQLKKLRLRRFLRIGQLPTS
jgi:hypothetical protein